MSIPETGLDYDFTSTKRQVPGTVFEAFRKACSHGDFPVRLELTSTEKLNVFHPSDIIPRRDGSTYYGVIEKSGVCVSLDVDWRNRAREITDTFRSEWFFDADLKPLPNTIYR